MGFFLCMVSVRVGALPPEKGLEFTLKCSGKTVKRKILKSSLQQNVGEFVQFEEKTGVPKSVLSVIEIQDKGERFVAWMSPFQQCSGSFFKVITPKGTNTSILTLKRQDWDKLVSVQEGSSVKARNVRVVPGRVRKFDLSIDIRAVPEKKNMVQIIEKGVSLDHPPEGYAQECLFDKKLGIPSSITYTSPSWSYKCDVFVNSPVKDSK